MAAQPAQSRPLPRAFKMTLDPEEVNDLMVSVLAAVNQILANRALNDPDFIFRIIYGNCYHLVLHKHGQKVYDGISDTIKEYYKTITRLRIIECESDADVIKTLTVLCNEHHKAIVVVRDIALYLERVFIPEKGLPSVIKLGDVHFREQVLNADDVMNKLRDAMLRMALQLQTTDTELLNDTDWSESDFLEACQALARWGEDADSLYVTVFEQPFLERSIRLHKIASQTLLDCESASDFLREADFRVTRERRFAKECLLKSTADKLNSSLNNELNKHIETVMTKATGGLKHMLDTDKLTDLGHVYNLLVKAECGVISVSGFICDYVKAEGNKLMSNIKDNDMLQTDLLLNLPIFDLIVRFDRILDESFQSDTVLSRMVRGCFVQMLDLHPRHPECVSLAIDATLRNRQLTETQCEKLLDNAVLLSRFIKEIEVFERYYEQHLAKRMLLGGKSGNDELELAMVLKLKVSCGCSFTNKLERLFNDIQVSDLINTEFKESRVSDQANQMDVSVRVLTCGLWPIQAQPKCLLPSDAQAIWDKFEMFYVTKHKGRKLNLNAQLGNAEVKAVFKGQGAKREYILVVSTYQMCVLMLFNKHTNINYQTLANETEMPERHLKRALQSLAMGKDTQRVLCRVGDQQQIEATDVFSINESFVSKRRCVRVQAVAQTQPATDAEHKQTCNKLNEDRKYEMDSTIVRVMKSQKSLHHNQLMAQVSEQLQSRFMPEPSAIKSRIGSLIEREYMARDSDNRNLYNYMA